MSGPGPLETWAQQLAWHQGRWSWLQTVPRYGLWTPTNGQMAAKQFVRLLDPGRDYRSARLGLGSPGYPEGNGLAVKRGLGVAIELSPGDAERYGSLLRDAGVEVFIRELPDLSMPEALREPTPTNGQPPTDTARPEPPKGIRTRKLGVILGEDVVAAIRSYSSQQQVLVKQVLDQMAREFFERHGWPPVLTTDGAPQAGRIEHMG